jgi:molybdopterin synthase sulfur carrier subunit
MTKVLVRYFASARGAAGHREESIEIPAGASVEQLISAIRLRHGVEMDRLLSCCSFLLDEVAVGKNPRSRHDGSTLDVLPPFAGG